MGLFINNDEHPNVYKNNEKINAPNQVFARHNFLTELLNEQQKANVALTKSIAELKTRYEQIEETQTIQWNHVKNQMSNLTVSSHHREEFESQMMQRLNSLDEKNANLQAVLENESVLKRSILDQINTLSESNQEIASHLEKNKAANQQLSLQLNEQLELQKEVADKLSNQEEFQAGVLKRLDNQEALTEKISRQLNHIRSILFERANYLAMKLEDGYKLTSSYVSKLMTGSDQPLTFSITNNKKREQQKHSD
ncbi:hypothetical protein [Ectobacillus panaciterrae]|uniref:hypothetical protein n=1 Tax=Ectobacillus panaciterrae TaxID=363872 RepID=UPI00042958B8|nr:hypothetical protein [Ectobacillus panaciterrae]